MDVCTYARFRRPGHRATGDRSQRDRHWMRPETRVGYDYAHAIVDDHSRLAYVELHDDEKAATVTAFVERALAFFAGHGITARRLMTDNAFTYVKNRSLRELLAAHGIRHLTTQPYRPRTNGKVERFHQTMGREWAHGRSYPQARTEPASWETGSSTTTTGDRTQHRRPATHQPRSQPLEAGQLAGVDPRQRLRDADRLLAAVALERQLQRDLRAAGISSRLASSAVIRTREPTGTGAGKRTLLSP